MKLHEPGAVRVGALVAALTVVIFEAQAGGARTSSSAQPVHRVPHYGVASFYRSSRNLPNGVSIFNGRPNTSRAHSGRSHQRAGRKPPHTDEHSGSKPGAIAQGDDRRPPKLTPKGASHGSKKPDGRRGDSRHAKNEHKRHEKNRNFYGYTAYYVAPAEEMYYSEQTGEDNCRSLIERGYDLSGRRVLVEWTLCFDDQGETYVPENGRRIVVRY